MKKKWYLITVNCDGSIFYMNEGSYKAMQKLSKESFHRVTSISSYTKACSKYGINR